jgi:hypothetical protein
MLQQHRLQKRESNYKDNIEMVRRMKGQTSESLFSVFFWVGDLQIRNKMIDCGEYSSAPRFLLPMALLCLFLFGSYR